MGVIYSIKSRDRFYIGSTKDFDKRMAEHRGLLEKGKHSNTFMQRMFNKYNDFEYVVLEEVDNSKLKEVEQLYIDKHYEDPNCMNGSPYAHRAYNPWTIESRKKMSESCKGRVYGSEVKKKQSLAKKGKKLSKEHRSNIMKARHKNAKIYTNNVIFKWNDKTYNISTLAEFLELFGKSSRCIFRRLAANKNIWNTLTRVREESKHPFKNGDKLGFFISKKVS